MITSLSDLTASHSLSFSDITLLAGTDDAQTAFPARPNVPEFYCICSMKF